MLNTKMIQWKNISTVLLDMDGTLLDLHYDNYFWLIHLPKIYAKKNNLSEKESRQALIEKIETHRSTLKWYCLDFWSQELNMDIVKHKTDVKDKIQLRPFTIEFLTFLSKHNIPRIIITNAHRSGLALKLQATHLEQHVDSIISSHDYQYAKEDIHFWHTLQNTINLDIKNTVFIDDNIEVLKTAKKFGINKLICINQPDSQKMPIKSNQFIDICHFNELVPSL